MLSFHRGLLINPFFRFAGGWRYLLVLTLWLALGVDTHATDFVDAVQPAALAQPMINVALSTSNGGPLLQGTTISPFDLSTTQTINLQAYFDTGASGILLSNAAQSAFGLQLETVSGTPITYQDVGAVGPSTFHVSTPLYVSLAPDNPSIDIETAANYAQLSSPVHAQIGPVAQAQTDELQNLIDQLLLGDLNVVGTPGHEWEGRGHRLARLKHARSNHPFIRRDSQ